MAAKNCRESQNFYSPEIISTGNRMGDVDRPENDDDNSQSGRQFGKRKPTEKLGSHKSLLSMGEGKE